jgi:hypothetical protein
MSDAEFEALVCERDAAAALLQTYEMSNVPRDPDEQRRLSIRREHIITRHVVAEAKIAAYRKRQVEIALSECAF